MPYLLSVVIPDSIHIAACYGEFNCQEGSPTIFDIACNKLCDGVDDCPNGKDEIGMFVQYH